jgi:hypothetical protein
VGTLNKNLFLEEDGADCLQDISTCLSYPVPMPDRIWPMKFFPGDGQYLQDSLKTGGNGSEPLYKEGYPSASPYPLVKIMIWLMT